MDYREIYNKVYTYMSEKVIEEDCGLLCNSHCCRNFTEDGEEIGIYLMPHEYESVYKDTPLHNRFRFEKHTSKHYYIPPKVKYLYYFCCSKEDGCIRDLRPIQCRTYPFEPHLEGNTLSLVVEREQIHRCPLLDQIDGLREEFVEGIYRGWKLLLEVPGVKELIQYDSDIRRKSQNIRYMISDFK